MIVYKFRVEERSHQYQAIGENIRKVEFIRNKYLQFQNILNRALDTMGGTEPALRCKRL